MAHSSWCDPPTSADSQMQQGAQEKGHFKIHSDFNDGKEEIRAHAYERETRHLPEALTDFIQVEEIRAHAYERAMQLHDQIIPRLETLP